MSTKKNLMSYEFLGNAPELVKGDDRGIVHVKEIGT